ncbi:MAG: T9SS type A sorting domain-containing protein [Owenweeksia sp.]|nr:T9SS type A sorting domain-containing protein [Owenweeksia sp.]
MLTIKDRDKDGLSFFANNDGSGVIRLIGTGSPSLFENLNPNFGTELRKEFTVGYSIGTEEQVSAINIFEVYPNPAKNQVQFSLIAGTKEKVKLSLTDLSGRMVLQQDWQPTSELGIETLSSKECGSGQLTS